MIEMMIHLQTIYLALHLNTNFLTTIARMSHFFVISENQERQADETGSIVAHQHRIPAENTENEPPSNNASNDKTENQVPDGDCPNEPFSIISKNQKCQADEAVVTIETLQH